MMGDSGMHYYVLKSEQKSYYILLKLANSKPHFMLPRGFTPYEFLHCACQLLTLLLSAASLAPQQHITRLIRWQG